MNVDNLFTTINNNKKLIALYYCDRPYSYEWVLERSKEIYCVFESHGIGAGSVVSLISDYQPDAISALLALIQLKAIIQPMTNLTAEKMVENHRTAQTEYVVTFNDSGIENIEKTGEIASHALTLSLRSKNVAGLIIMSSGTTGVSKAILHDLSGLINSLKPARSPKVVLSFLLFDHIGGINTLLNAFVSGNCLVISERRTPEKVSEQISRWSVEVMVTSPSFLNLMILKNCFYDYSLQSLRQINYGSEIMPEPVLDYLVTHLPKTKLTQAYGLSEAGVIKTHSDSNQSTFLRITDENVELRVRDNKLEIKSNTTMLGYMNAPSPFTDDGWLMTGDLVEFDGTAFRIIGRGSDMINVGGEKVFPAEIESCILSLEGVEDVIVSGEKNAILGNIVVAKIKPVSGVDLKLMKKLIINHCRENLSSYQVPQKVLFKESFDYGPRFKKNRQSAA